MTDDVMLQYYNLNNEEAALAPDPIVGNPATADVYAEVSAITPGLGKSPRVFWRRTSIIRRS